MHELEFGYVGLGAHEELVLSVAEALGFYAEEGVRVNVRDATAWDDERLRSAAIVGLGRTVLLRLRFGVPWTGVCVNTEHPMFWLMARPEFAEVQDLRGRRIGMHPALVAPGLFGRIVLRERGLDPDRDVDIMSMHPGDYAEHIGRLTSGELDAAVVGSTVSPEQLAAEDGLRPLVFFGDVFRIPTTGVAVDPTFLPLEDDGAVAALVRANVRASRALLDDPDVAVAQIRKLVPRVDDSGARDFYDRYVAPYFKRDGTADSDVVARAIPAVAAELGVLEAIDDGVAADAGVIYRSELTGRWISSRRDSTT